MNEMEKWLMLMDDLNEEVITEGSDCPCCDGGRGACSHGKDVCGTCGGSGKVEESVEEAYPMGMAPNAPEDRTEITYNQTKNSGPDAQVTINARAPNMEELKKVLAMAGLDPEGAEKHDIEEPDSVKVVDVSPVDDSSCGSAEPMGSRYTTDKAELIDMLKNRLQQKLG